MPITRSMTQASASKPMPTPFYEEQEIHEIANELEARIRATFEKDLATARQQMIDAMMKDRSQESGYMHVHISLEGAYDHKRDIVWVTGEEEEEDICECCGEPIEEAPAPASEPEPEPPCPYTKFQYKDVAKPERRSQRIAGNFKRKVESIVGATAYSEWATSLAKNLEAFVTLSSGPKSFTRLSNQLRTVMGSYRLLLDSSVTPVILRHHPLFRETSMVKADSLRRHCWFISEHVVSTDCNCYATYTDLEKSTIRLLATELKELCEEYLAMKY